MPAAAVINTVKLVIAGTCDNQAVVNVLHYRYTGSPPSAAALNTFITAWLTNHATQWYNCHGNNYALNSLTATDLNTLSGFQATQNVAGPGNTGSITGFAIPNNVALALSWRTGITGRRHRGRSYIGGLTSNAIAGDLASPAFASALSTLGTSLVATLESGIFDLAIASLVDHVSVAVTGFVIDTILDSMRRRLPGRGV